MPGLPIEAPTAAPARPTRLSDHQRGHVRGRYDAAQTTPENAAHWAWADHLSANAAMDPMVRFKLRNRARYEAANNCYCAGMLDAVSHDAIGEGPTLQMLVTQENGQADETTNAAIEMAWWRWQRRAQLAERLRRARLTRARDGEVFWRFVNNPKMRDQVKLDVRLYEADQVTDPLAGIQTNFWHDGLIFDDFGNVAGYRLLKHHPGDMGPWAHALEAETVPALQMCHWFRATRPGQCRGVPEITPALPLFAQLRRYTLAVVAAAESAADLAGIIKTQSPVEAPAELEPLDLIDIVRRSLMTLPEGWDMSQLKAEQPTTTYDMFHKAIIREIARCLNMPYNVAAGDSSGYNFASGKLDRRGWTRSIAIDRDDCELVVLEPTFERWWEEARVIPGYLPDRVRALREPPNHEWHWHGEDAIDPTKEANAAEVRLRNGLMTHAEFYAAAGKDWDDAFQQIAREQQRARELGIKFGYPSQQQVDDDPEADDAAE